jgi:hypothetical protein
MLNIKSLKTCLLPILISCFILLNHSSLAQQNDKENILKNIRSMIMPDTPNYVCATIPANERVQIIATANAQDKKGILSAIITSRLGKGKIIIIGSNHYFQKPLLDNNNIQNFIGNAIKWGKKSKKRKIQLWGRNNDLAIHLKKFHYQYISDSNNISAADIIILNHDITDSIKLNSVENFVKNGGTLIFGSPVSDLMKQYKFDYYTLYINQLFLKAGLYHTSEKFAINDNKGLLNTGEIPAYMHISTLLKSLKAHGLVPPKDEVGAYSSTIANYLFNNSDSATTFQEIDSLFGSPTNRLIIPSESSPVVKSDAKNYLAYQIQEFLNMRQSSIYPTQNSINPASKDFPGEVDRSAVRMSEEVVIPVKVGNQGLLEPNSVYYRWHSTGLYVAAGDKVSVTIKSQYIDQHLKAQIGVHEDDLSNMPYYARTEGNLTQTYELNKLTTAILSPFGGLLMINIPDTSTLKNIRIQVNGAVKAPYFKLGETTNADWQQTIRNYPAPWAELATGKIILTVPAYRIRSLDNPEKLMKFWDVIMDTEAKLANIVTKRIHPERIITDRQVAYGAYMFTLPHKIVVPDDESCELMLNEDLLRTKGSWGHFHELGHRHQFWGIDFSGLSEVTVNLYTMYIYDKVLHKGIYNHEGIPSKQAVMDSIKLYMANKPSFKKFCNDPFLALKMYIELIENFGWQSIEQVFETYRKLPKEQYPATEAQQIDYWFTCICAATHKDLSAFFEKWQIPVSQSVSESVKNYPSWLPPELK